MGFGNDRLGSRPRRWAHELNDFDVLQTVAGAGVGAFAEAIPAPTDEMIGAVGTRFPAVEVDTADFSVFSVFHRVYALDDGHVS